MARRLPILSSVLVGFLAGLAVLAVVQTHRDLVHDHRPDQPRSEAFLARSSETVFASGERPDGIQRSGKVERHMTSGQVSLWSPNSRVSGVSGSNTATTDGNQDGFASPLWNQHALEEDRRVKISRFEQRITTHSLEPVDLAWAPVVSRSIRSSLDFVAKQLGPEVGLGIVNVDCRTRTCLATLMFANYEAALESFASILTADYNVRCSTEIVFREPPAGREESGSEVLILDCSR